MNTRQSSPPARIDWDALYRRLEASRTACEREMAPSPRRIREILLERARRAAAPISQESAGEALEFVEFFLGGESYGLETRFVREIAPLRECAPIPGAPAHVLGVFPLRGSIVSLIDLRRIFGFPPVESHDTGKAIVLRHRTGAEFALHADRVGAVRIVARESIQPPLATQTGRRADFCLGVLADSLTILRAEWMLTDPSFLPRNAGAEGATANSPRTEGAQAK